MEKKPFPINLLPVALQLIVREASSAFNIPESYLAVSLLSAAASAIGNSRELLTPMGWRTKCIFYFALIGGPGAVKSPAIDFGLKPLEDADNVSIFEYRTELRRYRRTTKDSDDAVHPVAKQFLVKDFTLESIAGIHSANPRGVCYHTDELKAFFGAMNRYRSSGNDEEAWLTMYNGGSLVVNRKGDDDIIRVPSTCVNVIGGIQPRVLVSTFQGEKIENGFFSRFLFTADPKEDDPLLWNVDDLPPTAEDDWTAIIRRLIDWSSSFDFQSAPLQFVLNPDAADLIVGWQNGKEKHISENEAPSRREIFRKIQTYALRLCLLLYSLKEASGEIQESSVIDPKTVACAISLAEYFYFTSCEVYDFIQRGGNEDNSRFFTFLDALPNEFKTWQAIQIGKSMGLPERTIHRYLEVQPDDPLLSHPARGLYRKK